MSNVEPEETQAIMDLMGAEEERPAEIAERDFRRPRRLSGAIREDLARLFQDVVPQLEERLAEALGATHPLELYGVGEASAEEIVAESDDPLVALRFVAGGQPGWIVWENLAAVAAVEKILGSRSDSKERRLSRVECRVVEDLLGVVAACCTESLGFSAQDYAVAQSVETLGSWRDGGESADLHRLEVELSFEGPGEASTLRVYVPCPELAGGEAAAANEELPGHLNQVGVTVSAQFAGCEVSLDQLLALEEGDVIPIEARVGDLAIVTVEGCAFGRARLGRRRGQLAIRIEQLEEKPEETR